jgi:hypothetical protein
MIFFINARERAWMRRAQKHNNKHLMRFQPNWARFRISKAR